MREIIYLIPEFFLGSKSFATSVKENEIAKNKCLLFPNPSNGVMQLNYSIPTNETGVFDIFDLSGKSLISYALRGGKNAMTLSTTDLENGIYFYHLISNGKIIAEDKLVIIK